MKALITPALMAALFSAAQLSPLFTSVEAADPSWRAARTTSELTATAEGELPTAVATGITPMADNDGAPVVRTVSATENATKPTPAQTTSAADEPTVAGVKATEVHRPIVSTASYIRQISDGEMVGNWEPAGAVQPAAQLQPVPSNAAVYTAQAPTVGGSSYYSGTSTSVFQPVSSMGGACCDPCATCNPCQNFTPVTTFQPVAACPTGLCKNPTLRPGLWGQPSVHIDGQPIRNAFRWLVP
jgi:hypothetical protein